MSLKYPQTHTLGKHLYFDLDWGNAANTNGNASPSLKTQGFRQQRCCPYDLHLRPPAPGPPQPAGNRAQTRRDAPSDPRLEGRRLRRRDKVDEN